MRRAGPLHDNIVLRSKVISFIRHQMTDMGFLEIQTYIDRKFSRGRTRLSRAITGIHPGKFCITASASAI